MPEGDRFSGKPLACFLEWYAEAKASDALRYPGAMHLATVMPDGAPDGRVVLMHACDEQGIAFMTDVRSPKAEAIRRQPQVAITFYWEPLERQVRIQGEARLASEAEADAFFEERPRRSRGTAWASMQSEVLAERSELQEAVAEQDDAFAGEEVIGRPPWWRAYRVMPDEIEFWTAGARRLHERVRFERSRQEGWIRTLLAP